MEISREQYIEEVRRLFEEEIPARLQSTVRVGQLEMALKVAEDIWDERVLAVEAGTGVGKSLAYLIPVLLWRINGGTAIPVVSTKTLNLQDQLLRKDIPFVKQLFAEIYNKNINVAQARGMSNYLCRRRFVYLFSNRKNMVPEARAYLERMAEVVNRADDRGGLFDEGEDNEVVAGVRSDFSVPNRVWQAVCCDNWLCSKRKCSHYNTCFLYNDRRLLLTADVIVANHSFVLADAALRRDGANGLLPSQERLVFDEAHHLEDVATEQLSYSFMRGDCNNVLAKLQSDGTDGVGDESLLTRLRAGLINVSYEQQSSWTSVLDRLEYSCLDYLRDEIFNFFERLSEMFAERIKQGSGKVPLSAELLEETGDYDISLGAEAAHLENRLRECASLLGEALRLASAEDGGSMGNFEDDITTAKDHLGRLADALMHSLDLEDEGWIHWGEVSQFVKGRPGEESVFSNAGLRAAPLQIGDYLRDYMFREAKALILASATLRINNSMGFFLHSIGLPGAAGAGEEDTGVDELVCISPFDYRRQALLAVATDLNEYGGRFGDGLASPRTLEQLARLITALQGRTLMLFTSVVAMRALGEALEKRLAREGIEVLVQQAGQRAALVDKFRNTPNTVLLGTDSYWEGVDVPGDALQCVVVCKLPFVVPDEPIHKARMERIKAQGGNEFRSYMIPLAITKMRQGVGRLIRSVEDKGVILILDSRVHTKYYGRSILNALPSCTRQHRPLEDLVDSCLAWMEVPGQQMEFRF